MTAPVLLCVFFVAACGMETGTDWVNNNDRDAGYITDGTVEGCEVALALKGGHSTPTVNVVLSVVMTIEQGTLSVPNWSVVDPYGAAIGDFVLRDNERTLEFEPHKSGTYTINVDAKMFGGQECSDRLLVTVFPESYYEKTYDVLLTPSSTGETPRQETDLRVIGGTPQKDLSFVLKNGTGFDLFVRDEAQQGVRSYVRFESLTSKVSHEGFYTGGESGLSFLVEQGLLFNALVVPETDVVAPDLFFHIAPNDQVTLTITEGKAVLGNVLEEIDPGDYQPLGDVQVILRCAGIPSSVGTSRSYDGEFLLYARSGNCGLLVTPSAVSGKPNLSIEPSEYITVEDGTNTELELVYGKLETAGYSGTVLDEHGLPFAGAYVTLVSHPLESAGLVNVFSNGEVEHTLDASGYMKSMVRVGQDGRWNLQNLPRAFYDVIVESEDSMKTVLTGVDLSSGSVDDELIVLEATAFVSGRVVGDDNNPVSEVRVVATTRLGRGSSVETQTDVSGFFDLELVDGARYSLSFFPPAGSGWARLVNQEVLAMNGMVIENNGDGDVVLARGLSLEGRVTGLNPASVLIQVFDAEKVLGAPLYETLTNAAGRFVLILPDPGMPEQIGD